MSEAACITPSSPFSSGTVPAPTMRLCNTIASSSFPPYAWPPIAGRDGFFGSDGSRLAETGSAYTVREAFREFAGWDPFIEADQTRFDNDLVEKVEPHLGFPHPCILKDYPANQAALARLKPGDATVAERFELYWAGIELANGFSELTDAREQRLRFEATLEMRRQSGHAPSPLPETFLDSMEHLPPCAGIALGIDRLVMLLANADNLDQVVAFPPAL